MVDTRSHRACSETTNDKGRLNIAYPDSDHLDYTNFVVRHCHGSMSYRSIDYCLLSRPFGPSIGSQEITWPWLCPFPWRVSKLPIKNPYSMPVK